MKQKLTLLIIALVTSMGAWTATPVTTITSGGSYYFFNSRFNQYINTSLNTDENLFNGIKFTLTGSDGNYNIYSADKGGYLTWGTLENGAAPTISATTSENTLWTIDVQSGKIMNIYPKGQNGYELISQSATAGKAVALWSWNNQGGQWYIYEASDFEAERDGINSAVEEITSGNVYRIFTEYGNNNTKYYLTADGTLTTSENDAYYFTFTATTTDNYVPAGKAWRISSTTGKYFTNGSQSNGVVAFSGSINTTTGQNRDTYEGQVFVKNASGKYAVRSTNNKSNGGYAENSYWMVDDTNSDGVPEAGYCTTLEQRHYDWQLEAPSGYVTYNLIYNGEILATNNEVPKVLGSASASLPEGWDCAYCNLSYSPSTVEALTESVNVTLTWDGPFTFSTGFDGATWYYLSFRNKTKYAQMSTTIPYPDPTTKPTVSEGLWAFTGDPYNGIKVMNARAGDGKYLKKVSSDNGSAVTIQDGGQYWAIGVGQDGFFLKEPGKNNLYIHDYGSALKIWNSSNGKTDNGSGFQVESASPIKVTYKLTYNGNEISSYTKDLYELVGATAAAPYDWVIPAYCSLGSCSPATITAETTEVTIPLVWDGPFDFSTNYESAVWYYMRIGGKYVISADTNCPAFTEKQVKETGLWAFVGNPYDGFYIINYASGEGKRLDINGTCSMKAPSAFNIIQIKKVGDDCRMYNYDPDGSFFLFVDVDNYIKGGLEYETLCSALFTPVNWGELAKATIDNYAASHALGEYFGTDEDLVTGTKTSITAMGASFTKGLYESMNLSGLIKYPSTSKYYRIKNNSTGNYLAYGLPVGSGYSYTNSLIAIDNTNDASTIIKLIPRIVNESEVQGTYGISMQGLKVQTQRTANQPFPVTSDDAKYFVFNVATPGVVSITNTASGLNNGDYDGSLHEATEGWTVHGVVNWSASAAASKWVVEEAEEITLSLNAVGEATYGTTCLPFGVTLPAGDVCAYTLTDIGGGWVRPELLGTDGKSIPAGTPVLLRGTSTTSVTATIGDVDAINTDGNILEGTYLTMAHGNNLVLGKIDNVVGFYKYDFDIKPNKAYIPASFIGEEVKGFKLSLDDDDEATSINLTPALSEGEDAIYNLAGQRISKMQKGINIVNGKKVLR